MNKFYKKTMAKITRNNYEVYFIDYLEGNLTSSQRNEFIAFLESNPDIKEELRSWEKVKINPDTNIQFSEKNTLKKTHAIFSEEFHFEELCIAKGEGDLTESEASCFDQYIREEPKKAEIYNLYSKTKLKPDNSIVFPEKEKLKTQKSKLIKLNYQTILAFAASIALIIGLFFNYSTNNLIDKHKYTNLENFNKDLTIFASIKKAENNNSYTAEYKKNNKNKKNSISINDYLLPIAKVEENKLITSNNNSISKIKPTYFSELKTASENKHTTNLAAKIDQNILFADRITKSKEGTTQKGIKINSISRSKTQEQPNRFLLDIAALGFKSISKLTGKEIDLKRSYNDNGELKRLAFKTESFSISTKIKE